MGLKGTEIAMISPFSTEYSTPETLIPRRLANSVRETPNSRTAQKQKKAPGFNPFLLCDVKYQVRSVGLILAWTIYLPSINLPS